MPEQSQVSDNRRKQPEGVTISGWTTQFFWEFMHDFASSPEGKRELAAMSPEDLAAWNEGQVAFGKAAGYWRAHRKPGDPSVAEITSWARGEHAET